MRFDNLEYNNIFDYLPNNNMQFIKRKRKNSNKKSNKNKVVNKDSFNDEEFSFSESNTISEDYSVYDDIFDYKMIPNLNITEKENKILGEPYLKNNDLNNNTLNSFNNKEENTQYQNFIIEKKNY